MDQQQTDRNFNQRNDQRKSSKKGRFCKAFKSIDVFAQKVELSYRGEVYYKTIPGSLGTLSMFVVVFIYAMANIKEFLLRQNPSVQKLSYVRNLFTEEAMSPFELGFDIAFGSTTGFDESLISIDVYHSHYSFSTSDDSKINITTTKVPFSNCNEKNFNYANVSDIQSISFSKLLCIDNKDIVELQGNYFSNDFQFLKIQLDKCKNSTESSVVCQSQDKIDEYFHEGHYFNFILVNQFFDSEDFSHPIKSFLDDTLPYVTIENSSKNFEIYLKKNEARLDDDQYMLKPLKTIEYISIDKSFIYDINPKSSAFNVYFRYDPNYDVYNREVYNLFDWLGDVGGLQQMIYLMAFICVNIFSVEYLNASLIKQLFQLKQKSIAPQKEEQIVQKIQNGTQRLDRKDCDTLVRAIQERSILQFQSKDIAQEFIRCMFCRDPKNIKRNPKFQKQYQFIRAKEKLQRELDIVRILRSIQSIRIFRSLFFKNQHRFLLEFQQKKVLTSDTSSSSENEADVVKLITMQNPLLRQQAFITAKQLIQQFQRKDLRTLDKRIIIGMLKKTHDCNQQFPLFKKKAFIKSHSLFRQNSLKTEVGANEFQEEPGEQFELSVRQFERENEDQQYKASVGRQRELDSLKQKKEKDGSKQEEEKKEEKKINRKRLSSAVRYF